MYDFLFQPPVPIEPLTEVQKAFEEGSPCIQINALDFSNPNKITGDEDCLFLNIYTHDVSPVNMKIRKLANPE